MHHAGEYLVALAVLAVGMAVMGLSREWAKREKSGFFTVVVPWVLVPAVLAGLACSLAAGLVFGVAYLFVPRPGLSPRATIGLYLLVLAYPMAALASTSCSASGG